MSALELYPEPSWKTLTMTQSAHIRELNPGDYSNMHKNQYPIVLCYNGRDHYAPTRSCDPQKYYRWKMEKQLGPILSAGLLIIEEVDRTKLPPNVLQQVNQVEATIVQALPVILPTSNAAHLRRAAGQHPQRGPVFSQHPAGQVPPSDTQPDLSSSTTMTTPAPQPGADQPEEQTSGGGKKKRPKKGGYVCHICGKKRDRKPDLEGHLWNAHRVGEAIQCNIPPCSKKDFATKGSLKLHIKTQHTKKHEYKCKDCEFGSESRNYYHRAQNCETWCEHEEERNKGAHHLLLSQVWQDL